MLAPSHRSPSRPISSKPIARGVAGSWGYTVPRLRPELARRRYGNSQPCVDVFVRHSWTKFSSLFASRGRFFLWIPECFMAALTDILHPTTDIYQRNGVFGITSPQRFHAENLQFPGKGVKTLSIPVYKRSHLSWLQFNSRNLRLGSDGSRFATGHRQ